MLNTKGKNQNHVPVQRKKNDGRRVTFCEIVDVLEFKREGKLNARDLTNSTGEPISAAISMCLSFFAFSLVLALCLLAIHVIATPEVKNFVIPSLGLPTSLISPEISSLGVAIFLMGVAIVMICVSSYFWEISQTITPLSAAKVPSTSLKASRIAPAETPTNAAQLTTIGSTNARKRNPGVRLFGDYSTGSSPIAEACFARSQAVRRQT